MAELTTNNVALQSDNEVTMVTLLILDQSKTEVTSATWRRFLFRTLTVPRNSGSAHYLFSTLPVHTTDARSIEIEVTIKRHLVVFPV